MKAERNRTIDISVEDGKEYLERCLSFEQLMMQVNACYNSASFGKSGKDQSNASFNKSGKDQSNASFNKSRKNQSNASFGKSDKEQSFPLSYVLDQTILGDTFEVLAHLPKESVDLLIVDPPYNLDKDFHGNKFKKTEEKSYEEYTERWVQAVKPLLKKNASVYVCCDWLSGCAIAGVLKRHFHLRNRITWQREKGRGAQRNWKNGMEDIYFATNSGNYTFHVEDVKVRRKVVAPYKENGKPKDWEETGEGKFRNTYPSNFWDDISIPYWSMPENTAHPTQKPEKLLAKLILASSNENDVVLDPFLGSGSTAVAAKKLHRHFIGIEQNPQYLVWAQKRLEMADSDPSIQGYTDGVFWERNTTALQQRRKKKSEV